MPNAKPIAPFYLMVTDHDRGVFSVEDSMTDDRPWQSAAQYARNHQHRITCGPADRDALAVPYRSEYPQFAGVPPGSVVRQRG